MIDKRLIRTVKRSKKYIIGNVFCQWITLLSNILFVTSLVTLLEKVYRQGQNVRNWQGLLLAMVFSILVRQISISLSTRMGYLSSKEVKRVLREKIYDKLLRLGSSYKEQIKTSEIVQVAVEGVDQLEIYFSAYLPQFFYAMLAPLTLFAYLCFVNLPSAAVLLVCVPLIPISIALVQTWAKKLLSKYWGQYTALGDTFLENLQGLTTLKIYQSDQYKNDTMNEEAEKFRVITMKVLTMQLNSITIMDVIAYGGAAAGVILAATQYAKGYVDMAGCLLIILLSADFFIPMRQLGSFFHIAMNGMAASEKIFRFLDLEEPKQGEEDCPEKGDVVCEDLRFSYEEGREILHGVNLQFPKGSFTAIVGESGCGKSTISAILMGKNKDYGGKVQIGGVSLGKIKEESLMKHMTYISHQSYLFKGSVAENLRMGKADASEEQMWKVLEQVNLADFLRQEKGLQTPVAEKGSNFSGGQCQRLALARALLHDSPVYIFDEATSNIDVESENDIMRQIYELAKEKTVILISHRLANVVKADRIYVLEKGQVAEQGKHEDLLEQKGVYASLWNAQAALESYVGGVGV